MKGCLKFIFSTILTIIGGLALIVFLMFGGMDYLKGLLNSYLNPSPNVVAAQADKIANFSKMPKDYKIVKAVSLIGLKAAIAENKKTAQKMAVIDPGWVANVTKNDIMSGTVDSQIKNIASKFETPTVRLADLQTTQKGFFYAMGQKVPFVKMRAGVSGLKNTEYEGIIGVVTDKNKKNVVLVSMGEPGKYKQLQAESFFKSISLNEK